MVMTLDAVIDVAREEVDSPCDYPKLRAAIRQYAAEQVAAETERCVKIAEYWKCNPAAMDIRARGET